MLLKEEKCMMAHPRMHELTSSEKVRRNPEKLSLPITISLAITHPIAC